MKRTTVLLGIILMTAILSSSAVLARQLPTIGNVEKTTFKNLVQSYFHPSITGWGIGLNTANDNYLVAKFHAVSVKTISRSDVLQIIKEAKSGNATSWLEVRDRIKTVIDNNGTTLVKGRIQINKEQYILTGIVKTETTFTGDIRITPNYSTCVATNVSAENCELQSTKVGYLSITKKSAELEQGKDRVWAGIMNFNNTAYTFVALVNPRTGE